MSCWKVFLGTDLIDMVWFSKWIDADYVRTSLINRDGYDWLITVEKCE